MPRKPIARDKLVEAFELIVVHEGERAATLEAVAARAGVSKGGLLYHFASRQELVRAALEHAEQLSAASGQLMAESPRGAAREYLIASVWEDSALDRAILTAGRLAQTGDDEARAALARISGRWCELVMEDVQDPVITQAVVHMGEGLYHLASLGALPADPQEHERQVQVLLEALERLRAPRD